MCFGVAGTPHKGQLLVWCASRKLEGGLYPCVQVVLLLLFELFAHLSVGVPVQSCEQVLVVLFTGQPGSPLPLGFLGEGAL